MDSIRKKIDYYTHTIWGRWICNALVAACSFIAIKALLDYGMTIEHSLLLDQLNLRGIDIAAFTNYTPIVVAAVSFFLPGAAPVAAGLLLWMTSFAVCPYLVSLAALALLFAAPCNKVINALATLMPVAMMQFTAEQMDKLGASDIMLTIEFAICLMFIIAYASHMADKVPYAMSVPILFVALGVPAGFFGKFKHISFMKSYWLTDKMEGYFKDGIDLYPLDYLKELLIILVVFIVVMVVFTKLLTMKKTAIAKMSRDKRDAIAFAITTVVFIGALVGLKAYLQLETMEINYVMIVAQMAIAYVATRFITQHDPSLNVADEEKLKKFGRVTSVLSIIAIVAALGFGGYYYYQHKDDVTYTKMEGAIDLNIYDDEVKIIDVYPVPDLQEDVDCIWYKFTARSNDRQCAAVEFDSKSGKDIYKDAYLYDETGENEVVDFIEWEGSHQTWDFPVKKGAKYYIKIEVKKHDKGDKIHPIVFPNN